MKITMFFLEGYLILFLRRFADSPNNNADMKKAQRRGRKPKIDFSDENVLMAIKDMIEDGFLDWQIADCLGIHPKTYQNYKKRNKQFRSLLSHLCVRARGNEIPIPSAALFRKVWDKCGKSRCKTAKKFGISPRTLVRWMKKDSGIADVIMETDLAKYETLEAISKIIALGGVKGQDEFPGWSRYPNVKLLAMQISIFRKRLGLDDIENHDVFSGRIFDFVFTPLRGFAK